MTTDMGAGGLVSSTSTYRAFLSSQGLTGLVDLFIEEEELRADDGFNDLCVPYEAVEALILSDYSVELNWSGQRAELSQMGQALDWFYKELCETFNAKVQTILQAKGPILFETRGPLYRYEGKGGRACIRVFKDALMILPPNLDARRVPFLFLAGIEVKDYVLTLSLTDGSQYKLAQLGSALGPLEKTIREAVKAMRSQHADLLLALDKTLRLTAANRAARLLPEGLAVPLEDLKGEFPSLVDRLDILMKEGLLAEYYKELLALGDPARLAMGYKRIDPVLVTDEEGNAKELPPWALWLVMPAKDHKKAIVEFYFPNEKAATYLFRIEAGYRDFLMTLNRAFEASGFQRELLFLTDEDLSDWETNARMLLDRTPYLRALRTLFAGRVIHRTPENWRRNLLDLLGPD